MLRLFTLCAFVGGTPLFAQSAMENALNSALEVEPGPVEMQTADPRAVEYCQKTSGAFTGIAKCLPDAHVSFLAMDYFANTYPDEAQPLRERCDELNDSPVATTACITEAIQAALDLSQQLPDGTELGDTVYSAIINDKLFDGLKTEIERAKDIAPDKIVWGGTLFNPYK